MTDEPKITVSGNGITVWRLDEQGNPIGEGLTLDSTAVSLNIHPDPDEDLVIEGWDRIRNTYTLDMCLSDVDPNLLALLTGGARFKPRPWWWRWVPRRLKITLKRREIRRGYGGLPKPTIWQRVDWEVVALWCCGLAFVALIVAIISFSLAEWVL